MILIIAHRGASACELENSLAAFRAARTMGADGVELDVHATSDGVLVVHHDPVAGGARISDLPLSHLRGHQLANGELVPTLAEALDTLGPHMHVYVEVKSLPPSFDTRLLAALDRGPAPQHYQVHSFDHRIVHRLHAQRPKLGCGLLSCSYPLHPLTALHDVGATVLWQREDMVDADLVRRAHEGGCRVYPWTVDEPDRMRALLQMNVDAVCTNRPDVAREVLG